METQEKKKISVFLAEDDDLLAKSMANLLVSKGLQVLVADSVKTARVKLDNQKFAVLILDIQLKDGNTLELIREIRNDRKGPNKDTPIILTSGLLDKSLINTLGHYVQDALVKPFKSEELIHRIVTVLKGKTHDKR
jgi:DNA-binding response OmpR family regulator